MLKNAINLISKMILACGIYIASSGELGEKLI